MELEKIREIVAGMTQRDMSEIQEHTRFSRDLGMDSLDVFQLTVELEAYFSMDIPENALAKIKTIGDAAELLKTLA